jgi:hypothetical protein
MWRMMSISAAILVLTIANAGPVRAQASDKEITVVKPFHGAALFVRLKSNADASVSIENPEVRSLAGLPFLVGHPLDASQNAGSIWMPLSDVLGIEEFADAKELARRYKIDK